MELVAGLAGFVVSTALLLGIGRIIWSAFATTQKLPQPRVCLSCGTTVARAKRAMRGSIWLEIVLWCCLLLPGLVYSIWRHTTRHLACPECGGAEMVPAGSPRAMALLKEYERQRA
jgi:predicted RNA-binding Zn-ribbon protein involved in translation (DUF1610 family)